MVLIAWPIFVCTTVELEKIIHATRSAVINNVADDGLLLIAHTALEAILRLRPKFHRFDLSLYLLQSWLYNI